MKNNKGFTLIELLAVIVILAIIALIAVPIILNVIDKSKQSSAVDSAYGYIHAIEEGIATKEVKDGTIVADDEYENLREFETNNEIGVKGTKPSSGFFRLQKRRVVYAELVIDGYSIICDTKKCESKGKTELITITYDVNGGNLNKSSERVGKGTNVILPTPTRDTYGFDGWYLGDEKVNNETVFNEAVTLVAHWIKDSYTITFDGNGGTPDVSTKTVEHGGNLGELPRCTAPEGYTFNGWYTESTGGEEIEEDRIFTSNQTLYAHYTKNIYTVTYNAGSGSVTPTSTTVEHGNTIELPTPVAPTNYSFAGWYTGENGSGTKVTNSTQITSTQTIYAYYIQTVTEFAYTGSEQTFTVPATGKYKLEIWGAQGGTAYNGNQGVGGYGGYSIGIVSKDKNSLLYINVGGAGVGTKSMCGDATGGYNGGGNAYHWYNGSSCDTYTGSGGGATHIATVSGQLKDLSSYKDTGGTNISNEILIVAGAGGGSGYYSGTPSNNKAGGAGGGYVGNPGNFPQRYLGLGGTQTAAGGYSSTNGYSCSGCTPGTGGFGYGGNSSPTGKTGNITSMSGGTAGGSGWYGGGGSSIESSAGGGSGYIGSSNLISSDGITKHMTCYNCTTSTVANTYTNSNTCHNSNPTIDCAKEGHGYARITYIGE